MAVEITNKALPALAPDKEDEAGPDNPTPVSPTTDPSGPALIVETSDESTTTKHNNNNTKELSMGGSPDGSLNRNVPSNLPSGPALIEDAMYRQIARLVIMGEKVGAIAEEIGKSDRQIRRILHRDDFRAIYSTVAEEMFGDIDKILRDEKIRPMVRAQAQAVRAQTLITKVIDEINDRIDSGAAKSTEMKVGVETAFGIIDRAKGELSNAPGAQNHAHVDNLTINNTKKTLIRATVDEAGLDLSDIIDVSPIPDNE